MTDRLFTGVVLAFCGIATLAIVTLFSLALGYVSAWCERRSKILEAEAERRQKARKHEPTLGT